MADTNLADKETRMPPRDTSMIPTLDLIENITRRRLLTAVPALGIIAAGLSCGDDDSEPGGDPSPTGTTANAFPVTIKHAYGETTIDSAPQRLVTVGYTDHDILLALGISPVGLRDWYGDYPQGVWPWAQQALGDEQPAKLTGELDFEAIAALEPDLILGLYVGLTEQEYGSLSRIAPTVAQSGEYENYSTPWQEMTRTAGQALGRQAAAEDLIKAVEDRIAGIREEHPEFSGKELVYAGVAEGGQFYVETSGSTRVNILTSLGFVVPAEIDALATDSFFAEISSEQLRILDRDVVFWELGATEGARPIIEADPVYRLLDAAREGRHVFVDDPVVAGALAHADVLSIPFFLDRIVPRLVAALDGDPATSSD
jgi:iron complex transport system substrate-binding protein